MYIYIYIYRHVCVYVYIYIHIRTTICIYCKHMINLYSHVHVSAMNMLAQDNGGPSKGGFTNNILCSYIMYIHIPLISLHKYRSSYEDRMLFRKPPLLGPPLSLPEYGQFS